MQNRWFFMVFPAWLYVFIAPVSAEIPYQKGNWFSEDIGQILEIKEDEFVVYDAIGDICLETDRLPREKFNYFFTGIIQQDDPDQLVLNDEDLTLSFKRLKNLPEGCAPGASASNDLAINFNTFINYFDNYYGGFEPRHYPWEEKKSAMRREFQNVTGADQLWDLYESLFKDLKDPHLFANNNSEDHHRVISSGEPTGLRKFLEVRNPGAESSTKLAARQAIDAAQKTVVQQEFLGGNFKSILQGRIFWGRRGPDFGYISIDRFTGYSDGPVPVIAPLAEETKTAFKDVYDDLKDATAIIVDVRRNPGGNDILMQTIVSFFLTEAAFYNQQTKTGNGFLAPQRINISPNPDHFTQPLFLVVDGETVSSAEIFTMILKDQPNVQVVGERTKGGFSSFIIRQLPDGADLVLPNQQVTDANGKTYEGTGITPDINVPAYANGKPVMDYLIPLETVIVLLDEPPTLRE